MKGVLHLIYPPQCLGCAASVTASTATQADLCHDCWRDTRFITGTCCHRCGAPLPDDGAAQTADAALTCDDCLAIARPWTNGRAALVYSGIGRQLVLSLKHSDRPDLAPALAGWLASAARPLIRPDMIVAPVPLHLRRLFKRKYNQAALMSAHLSRTCDLEHRPDLLIRRKHTQMQDHRGVADRFENLRDAIVIHPRHVAFVAGRRVLLVDDVMTSGATLSVATQALLEAGSGSVSVAVLARAVKND
ncbi:ComF family protein [Paracoccus sp. 11-3]|uniref:ComF family protein n=1 Tax=Paracoccus amoyensis TaxID=2760093 RepID=A0A926GBB7_9RHOB|nr:ComF family protein [Paracoccus amoyensis]MBC9247878.1 ComF family protein [Paracoccus amoyensis]